MPVTLICGNAADWRGRADLVLTNPYARLPGCLHGVPTLISNFTERKVHCEAWVGAPLHEIGAWGRGLRNRIWSANLDPVRMDLTDLEEEEFAPGRGWFPLDLPRRLLAVYGRPGITVWDGFCGRGTVGKACLEMGMSFVGIDRDPERVNLAKAYIGC